MPDRIEVFNRRNVADIVDLHPAVVRNWSSGKPITISPSVDAPRQRGAPSLYSRTDVLLFAVAKYLSEEGFALAAIERVFATLDHAWLELPERGSLVLAGLNTEAPFVEHISGTLSADEASERFARILLRNRRVGHYVAPLKWILQPIDKQIEGVKGQRANEKKNKEA